MPKEKQHLSFDEVLAKLMKYCAYQERSELEAAQKAKDLGADDKTVAKLLEELLEEGFVNNRRFAELYTRGKLIQKKWGKYKIIEGLRMKGLSRPTIQKVVNEIDDEIYQGNLQALIAKKKGDLSLNRDQQAKLYRYLVAKGYESALIMNYLG